MKVLILMSVQDTDQFVTGSAQPNLSFEISSLPVVYLGATMKFCEYLSQLRQQRFSDDEQTVINALVNGSLQYWQSVDIEYEILDDS